MVCMVIYLLLLPQKSITMQLSFTTYSDCTYMYTFDKLPVFCYNIPINIQCGSEFCNLGKNSYRHVDTPYQTSRIMTLNLLEKAVFLALYCWFKKIVIQEKKKLMVYIILLLQSPWMTLGTKFLKFGQTIANFQPFESENHCFT